MKTYKLVNKNGCVLKSIETDNFKEARRIFKKDYWGVYKIVCEEDIHHVKL